MSTESQTSRNSPVMVAFGKQSSCSNDTGSDKCCVFRRNQNLVHPSVQAPWVLLTPPRKMDLSVLFLRGTNKSLRYIPGPMFICVLTYSIHTLNRCPSSSLGLLLSATSMKKFYDTVITVMSIGILWHIKSLKGWNHCSSCIFSQAPDVVGLCCSHSMHSYLNFNLGLELQMPFPLFLGSSIVSFALRNPQAGLRAGLLTSFTGTLWWGFIKTELWGLRHCSAQSNSKVLQTLQSLSLSLRSWPQPLLGVLFWHYTSLQCSSCCNTFITPLLRIK